jgi:hypothetical protein
MRAAAGEIRSRDQCRCIWHRTDDRTPHGRMFVFSRDAGGTQSGELHIVHLYGVAKWLPLCAGRP